MINQQLKTLKSLLRTKLNKVNWLRDRKVPILAIGGSARNIARIHQALISYPIAGVHGYTMEKRRFT